MANEGLGKRRYPRRRYTKGVGILCGGQFFICNAQELGEGGLSFMADFTLAEGKELIINFQVPAGDFYSLRATTRHVKKSGDFMIIGIAFKEVSFTLKRQIRSFVSARTSAEPAV